MVKWTFLIMFMLWTQTACVSGAANGGKHVSHDIMKFAYASCLFQYFTKKGIDTEDIRNISGGIVEVSTLSIDDFQKIARIVNDFDPALSTKNKIDKDINKCFYLDDSEELKKMLH